MRAPRFLGIDEGPFTFDDETVLVAGVMTRGAHPVEAIVLDRVAVDGWDATDTVLRIASRLPGAGPDVLLLNGISLGGMNLVDLERVARTLRVPALGVTRREPGPGGLQRAAERAPDAARRRALLPTRPPLHVAPRGRSLWVHAEGPEGALPHEALELLLEPSMAESGVPEALRLAHHVATAAVRGVSGTAP